MKNSIDLISEFLKGISEEISLQRVEQIDSQELFTLIDLNREYLREYFGWLDDNTQLRDTKNFLLFMENECTQNRACFFGIYYKGGLVGCICLDAFDYLNLTASIGWWLGKEYQGKGIICQCAKKLIAYSFSSLHLNRIEARCAIHNLRSKRGIEKIGFVQEGILKKAIKHYETFFDAYLYAIVNE